MTVSCPDPTHETKPPGMWVKTTCPYGSVSMIVPPDRADEAIGYTTMGAALARSEQDLCEMICNQIGSLQAEMRARKVEDRGRFTEQDASLRSMIGLFTLSLLSCRPELAIRIADALKIGPSAVSVNIKPSGVFVEISGNGCDYSQSFEASAVTAVYRVLH